MKLEKIHIVTEPNPGSLIEDICFEVRMDRLFYQFLGGLCSEEIIGYFTEKDEALKVAQELLIKRDGSNPK